MISRSLGSLRLKRWRSFTEVGDEVGQSEARLLLGDYYANEEKFDDAIQEYKAARKLDMRHGDAAGLSRCHRRLGHAYLLKKEWIRAEEALDQAQDYSAGRKRSLRARLTRSGAWAVARCGE